MIHPITSTREYYEFGIDNPNMLNATFLERLKNPYEAFHAPRKESDVFVKGDLVDCLWLVPDEFSKRFFVLPENAPRKPTPAQINAKNPSPETTKQIIQWTEFQMKCEGRTHITQEMMDQAKGVIEALDNHPDASYFRGVASTQLMASAPLHYSPDHTFERKILADLVPEDVSAFGDALGDLKIWNVIEDEDISRRITNWDIHMRAAFYLDTYNAAALAHGLDEPIRTRYILLIAHWDTAEVKLVEFDHDDLQEGRKLYMQRIQALIDYREQGCPKYGTNRGVRVIKRMPWARKSRPSEKEIDTEEEIPV